MNRRGSALVGVMLLALAFGSPASAADEFEFFPAAEVREAHALRQRVLEAVPGLDLARLRLPAPLSPESLSGAAEQLAAAERREKDNPFLFWLQGELLRRSQGSQGAGEAYARAAEAASGRAVVHWILWREHLARGLWREAGLHEDALASWQLSQGLTRAPLLAGTLAAVGRGAAERGDPAAAQTLFGRALRRDPGHAGALAGRAGATWDASPARLVGVIGDSLRSLAATFGDRLALGRLGSNLILSLSAAWLACLTLAAALAAVRHHGLFLHDMSEGLLRRFSARGQRSLALLLLLLPLMLGMGLLWTAGAALILLAPYLSRRERLTVSILLAGMLLMPLGYRWAAEQHRLAASERLATSLAVEQGGRGEALLTALRAWRSQSPSSGLAAYFLGLTERRRGDLAAAESAMAEAVKLRPGWSFAHTGLGNIQLMTERVPEAEKSYQRALSIRKSFAAAANLGALYAAQLSLDKSAEWLAVGRRLDPHGAAVLAEQGAKAGTILVVDEPVPAGLLAAGLSAGDEGDAVAEGLWGGPWRGLPMRYLPGLALLLLAAFWGHAYWRGSRAARRCQECGTPFCAACHHDYREQTYCAPCVPVFRGRDGVPALVKLKRFREADAWIRRERLRAAWLGSLIPGGGWWVRETPMGPGVCVFFLWVLAEGILLPALTPNLRFDSPLPGSLRVALALLVLLAGQGLSIWWSRR
ncbi:MAG: hypothetical protein WC713_02155, partial [Candidatus Methylomirabilota bacterium]